jgi:hypothetical protein
MEMDDLATWTEQVEVIDGWRCIGCGRVEASRPCVGIATPYDKTDAHSPPRVAAFLPVK